MQQSNYPAGRLEAEKRLAKHVVDNLIKYGIPVKDSLVLDGDLHIVLPLPEVRGTVS
ncbi:hypothetical protein D3C87_2167490 [compost metagenome]